MSTQPPSKARPRNAKVSRVLAYEVTCPYCDEGLGSPSGSFIWFEDDIPGNGCIKCYSCGRRIELPARVLKEKQALNVNVR